MRQIFTTLLNTVLWVVILVLLFLVSSGLYQHFCKPDGYNGFFGIGYAVVVSGSMEPAISVNDMIIYQDVKQDAYKTDDVVVYRRDKQGEEILITHRLIAKGESSWTTKGDANASADSPIDPSVLVGKVVVVVPKAGKVVNFLKSTIGVCVMLGTIAFLTLLSVLVFDSKPGKEKVVTVNGRQTVKY